MAKNLFIVANGNKEYDDNSIAVLTQTTGNFIEGKDNFFELEGARFAQWFVLNTTIKFSESFKKQLRVEERKIKAGKYDNFEEYSEGFPVDKCC